MNESRILKPGPSTLSIPVGDGQIGRRVDPEQLMQIVGDICTTSPDALTCITRLRAEVLSWKFYNEKGDPI